MLGRRELLSKTEIIGLVQKYCREKGSCEDWSGSEALLFFYNSTQRTWLVATRENLYCVLDDSSNDTASIEKSFTKDDLIAGSEVKVTINVSDRDDIFGFVDIAAQKKWLYNKKLFNDISIKAAIQELISKTMI